MDNPLAFTNETVGTIAFVGKDNSEMLRLAPEGFYVRGVKLEQDADEARAVYNAFTAWMDAVGIMRRN